MIRTFVLKVQLGKKEFEYFWVTTDRLEKLKTEKYKPILTISEFCAILVIMKSLKKCVVQVFIAFHGECIGTAGEIIFFTE